MIHILLHNLEKSNLRVLRCFAGSTFVQEYFIYNVDKYRDVI